jgi:hypothetical protein
VVTGVHKNVGLEGKRRREKTDLVRVLFLVAFFYRTEHPFCHGLIADTKLDGSIQDRSAENGVGIPSSRPRTGSVGVH